MGNGMNRNVDQIHHYYDNKSDMVDNARAVISYIQESMSTKWELEMTEEARHGLTLILSACSNTLKALGEAMSEERATPCQSQPAPQTLSEVDSQSSPIAKVG